MGDEGGARRTEGPWARPLRGRGQGQQEGRRLRARHLQDQEPQVRHRGGHHDPEDRRSDQARAREGRREVIPAGVPVRRTGRLIKKELLTPCYNSIWLVTTSICTTH